MILIAQYKHYAFFFSLLIGCLTTNTLAPASMLRAPKISSLLLRWLWSVSGDCGGGCGGGWGEILLVRDPPPLPTLLTTNHKSPPPSSRKVTMHARPGEMRLNFGKNKTKRVEILFWHSSFFLAAIGKLLNLWLEIASCIEPMALLLRFHWTATCFTAIPLHLRFGSLPCYQISLFSGTESEDQNYINNAVHKLRDKFT